MSNRELITALIKRFDLHPDDAYIDIKEGFKIIRRRGYMKIQHKIRLEISLNVEAAGADWAIVKARGIHPTMITRQTLGEANPLNSSFPYPAAVAQKRAEGRLILEMADLYIEGWMTEDEIDQQVKGKALLDKRAKQSADSIDATIDQLGLKKHPAT